MNVKKGKMFILVVQMNAASSILYAVKKLVPKAPVKRVFCGSHFVILFL